MTTFSPGVITVSRVEPGTHIMPHCGPTNALVRVHLPIKIPGGVWIKVGGRRLVWEEGRCLVFDDSFEHEVGHEGTEDRVVLILDTLHPDLAGDHGERLLQRRLNTEEQILAFMRDGGFARVEVRDGEVAIRPGPAMRDLLLRHMNDTGTQGARPESGTRRHIESGTRRYIEQVARTNLCDLIDAWQGAGELDKAGECAQLAVAQGVWAHPSQRDRDHLPGLAAQPLHHPAGFWFTGLLEERFPEIQAEILAGVAEEAHLFREGRWQEDVCAHLPVTRAVLEQIPEVTTFNPGDIKLSRLRPGGHIPPHCGPTNAVLRLHLPISPAQGGWMRVAEHTVGLEAGRCIVFDDSFENEVKHSGVEGGDEDLVMLILDLAHPGLDPAQLTRLLADRPAPEERLAALMKERGIEDVSYHDGEVVLSPGEEMRQLIFQYMRAANVTGVEVDGDAVRWLQTAAETG